MTVDNDSSIPPNITFATEQKLSTLEFCTDDIVKIIKSLDPNKAHGHDEISIRMIKLCATSISKPLSILFRNCFENQCFPNEWKRANIVPVHKKNDKQLIKNYRPVSLLPVCSKIFEKVIFNSLFKYLEDNNLLNGNQSGFRPGDSCVRQLLSITHEIYKAFDANPSLEVRGIFLDLSKAFDKVWHDGLMYKLKRLGICGKYYGLIHSFLNDRHQRVVLNGQCSNWSKIKAGVPQGSILGSLLFLVYINDLPEGLTTNAKLFADDTSLFSVVHDSTLSSVSLNNDLIKISQWAYQWKMMFNPDVSKQAQEVVFSRKGITMNHATVYFNNDPVIRENFQKHLGLFLDSKLNFSGHINEKIKKATKGINVIRKMNLSLPRSSLLTIYKSFVRPHLDYGDVIYDQPNNTSLSDKIESVQYNAVLAITGAIRGTSKEKLYQELGLESLRNRRWLRRMSYLYKIISTKLPPYLYDLIPPLQKSHRYPGCFKTLRCRTELFRNSFLSFTVNEWNKLDSDIKNSDSYEMFRKKLLAFLRPVGNSMYGIYDPFRVKLINRLRLGFSHLREHKFRHNFADTVNPLCSCALETENTEHFFLRCQNNLSARTTLMNELNNISNAINPLNSIDLIRVILYGDKNFDNVTNFKIITATIKFIKTTKRFEEALF